jgi:RNA polymerase sigma-70 factor, ECF subfamily
MNTDHDDALTAFTASRSKLFGIAYRMTGSVADADDLVQETWVRWQQADRGTIGAPEGWLVRVVSNLSIDRSRSAASRRVDYVGPYLPEPVQARESADDPAAAAELADSLTFAFLVMLDELSPDERAVLLLHDVFGHSFDEVAELVGRSPAAVRQLASRSRRRLADVRGSTQRDQRRETAALQGLVEGLLHGDAERVLGLLRSDVVLLSDGGPSRHAARRPVVGADRAGRLLLNLAKKSPPDIVLEWMELNGGTALRCLVDGRTDYVMTVDVDDESRIDRIFIQLCPDKLAHLDA